MAETIRGIGIVGNTSDLHSEVIGSNPISSTITIEICQTLHQLLLFQHQFNINKLVLATVVLNVARAGSKLKLKANG